MTLLGLLIPSTWDNHEDVMDLFAGKEFSLIHEQSARNDDFLDFLHLDIARDFVGVFFHHFHD